MQGGIVAYMEYSLKGVPQDIKVPAFILFSKKIEGCRLGDGNSRSRKRSASAPAANHFLEEVQTGTTYTLCTNPGGEFGAQAVGIELSAL